MTQTLEMRAERMRRENRATHPPQSGQWTPRRLQRLWAWRHCFICGRTGNCGHREREVDLALLEIAERMIA